LQAAQLQAREAEAALKAARAKADIEQQQLGEQLVTVQQQLQEAQQQLQMVTTEKQLQVCCGCSALPWHCGHSLFADT
jgi:hypothetical protein